MNTINLTPDDITTILDALEELSGDEADKLARLIRNAAVKDMPAKLTFGDEE